MKKIKWERTGNITFYILSVFGIIVLVNLISSIRSHRFDLTSNKIYSLSSHTLSLLKTLKNPIKIIFFRSPIAILSTVEDLVKEYERRSIKITVDFVDPDTKPELAKKYKITSLPLSGHRTYATLLFTSGDKEETLDVLTVDFKMVSGRYQQQVGLKENLEREISSVILRLTQPKKKIYFTKGYGEIDLDSFEPIGFSELKKVLEKENYIVERFVLSALGKIPDDAAVIVIGSPKKSYSKRENDIIKNYLNKGGKLVVLADPPPVSFEFLKDYGVSFGRNLIIDTGSPYWGQPAIPLVSEYGSHTITEKIKYASFFPEVCSVNKSDRLPNGVNITEIVKSSKFSWAETDLTASKVKYDKGIDKKGPITMIAAIEKDKTKIVVSGDSDFVSNQCISSLGNVDLFLNIINWLAGKEELIAIRSKDIEFREMQLTKSKLLIIFYSSVIALPILVLLFGGFVWWKRR